MMRYVEGTACWIILAFLLGSVFVVSRPHQQALYQLRSCCHVNISRATCCYYICLRITMLTSFTARCYPSLCMGDASACVRGANVCGQHANPSARTFTALSNDPVTICPRVAFATAHSWLWYRAARAAALSIYCRPLRGTLVCVVLERQGSRSQLAPSRPGVTGCESRLSKAARFEQSAPRLD